MARRPRPLMLLRSILSVQSQSRNLCKASLLQRDLFLLKPRLGDIPRYAATSPSTENRPSAKLAFNSPIDVCSRFTPSSCDLSTSCLCLHAYWRTLKESVRAGKGGRARAAVMGKGSKEETAGVMISSVNVPRSAIAILVSIGRRC